MSKSFDLTHLRGTIAVVTGAGNGGIGWGLAKHCASLGMDVAIIDLHESLVTSARDQLLKEFDVACLGIACDVTDPAALQSCAEEIQAELPGRRFGAIFANAGVIFNRTILKSTLEEWQTTLNVNVVGVINTIQAFVPHMQASELPSIFSTTASIGGLVRGDGGGAAYQASKHAVVALTESLSFELASKSPQISIHVLCPCIVESGLGATSRTNLAVKNGDVAAEDVKPTETAMLSRAMTTERHAQQVFDHIAAGNFYMITDNVRPYVDHDHPFDGLNIVKERFDNLIQLQIDNSDAFEKGPTGIPTSILKGPLWRK